ncbi:hypothetical protein AC578_3811 [Pseudocercospora eumusae]|uniref:Uncharacterized protein n=1 Tax=Pseudocercospora eumusae TaxID=321146 RepID=A0A139HFK8_9PEZI|nr:hypothetical protein AC578_3811 [Pseudocercospora eumusae]
MAKRAYKYCASSCPAKHLQRMEEHIASDTLSAFTFQSHSQKVLPMLRRLSIAESREQPKTGRQLNDIAHNPLSLTCTPKSTPSLLRFQALELAQHHSFQQENSPPRLRINDVNFSEKPIKIGDRRKELGSITHNTLSPRYTSIFETESLFRRLMRTHSRAELGPTSPYPGGVELPSSATKAHGSPPQPCANEKLS